MTLLLPARCPLPLDSITHTDLLTLCSRLEPQSVDMILADLPYGTTACYWDEVIPFEPMWAAFKRIIKPRGAIVLTASQPFTSKLVCSNLEMFRYEWVWIKNKGSNFANANFQPFKDHENILVFYGISPTYNPQMEKRAPGGESRVRYPFNDAGINPITGLIRGRKDEHNILRLPSSVQKFNCEMGYHPTQKPVALFEYLIRTYTQPGELVFDPCVGSGTTAIAARNTGRHFICGDLSAEYVTIARNRLAQPYTLPMFDRLPIMESVSA